MNDITEPQQVTFTTDYREDDITFYIYYSFFHRMKTIPCALTVNNLTDSFTIKK